MNVYISAIKLKNFQSWSDLTLQLSEGFNVIRSDHNNVGKSVVMKSIKISLNPNSFTREERKGLIRHGAEYAEAVFLFSDGTGCMTRVLPSKILYYYYEEGQWHQQQDMPFPQAIAKLGGIVDTNTGLIANLLDLDQPLLLLKSDNKTNHSLIELITKHDELAKLIPMFHEKFIQYTNKRIEVNVAVKSLERQVNEASFIDVNKMEQDIDLADDLLAGLEPLYQGSSLLNNSLGFTENVKDYDSMLEILEFGDVLRKANSLRLEVPIQKDYDSMLDILEFGDVLRKVNALELQPPKHDMNLLNAIECLITAKQSLDNIREEFVNDVQSSRDTLIKGHRLLQGVLKDISQIEKDTLEIAKIEQELKLIGAKALCPIHGTIVIKDDKCSSYNT